VSREPDPAGAPGDQPALVARLRAVIQAKDTELAAVRAELAVLRTAPGSRAGARAPTGTEVS